jgi:hypothetical protein
LECPYLSPFQPGANTMTSCSVNALGCTAVVVTSRFAWVVCTSSCTRSRWCLACQAPKNECQLTRDTRRAGGQMFGPASLFIKLFALRKLYAPNLEVE